jgi:hypothetical protein
MFPAIRSMKSVEDEAATSDFFISNSFYFLLRNQEVKRSIKTGLSVYKIKVF